jgi:hypothetical protein
VKGAHIFSSLSRGVRIMFRDDLFSCFFKGIFSWMAWKKRKFSLVLKERGNESQGLPSKYVKLLKI